jgi:hypothetical protein
LNASVRATDLQLRREDDGCRRQPHVDHAAKRLIGT